MYTSIKQNCLLFSIYVNTCFCFVFVFHICKYTFFKLIESKLWFSLPHFNLGTYSSYRALSESSHGMGRQKSENYCKQFSQKNIVPCLENVEIHFLNGTASGMHNLMEKERLITYKIYS